MSLLIRAAVLGAIAYFISRSLSKTGGREQLAGDGDFAAPVDELHPGENTSGRLPIGSRPQRTQGQAHSRS